MPSLINNDHKNLYNTKDHNFKDLSEKKTIYLKLM